jgi:hypothetical protein
MRHDYYLPYCQNVAVFAFSAATQKKRHGFIAVTGKEMLMQRNMLC